MNVNLIIRVEADEDKDESVQVKLTGPIENLLIDPKSPAAFVAKMLLETHYPELLNK